MCVHRRRSQDLSTPTPTLPWFIKPPRPAAAPKGLSRPLHPRPVEGRLLESDFRRAGLGLGWDHSPSYKMASTKRRPTMAEARAPPTRPLSLSEPDQTRRGPSPPSTRARPPARGLRDRRPAERRLYRASPPRPSSRALQSEADEGGWLRRSPKKRRGFFYPLRVRRLRGRRFDRSPSRSARRPRSQTATRKIWGRGNDDGQWGAVRKRRRPTRRGPVGIFLALRPRDRTRIERADAPRRAVLCMSSSTSI